MITGKSIATLVIFILSIIFVIHAVHIQFKYRNHNIRIPINLTTAPIAAIAILWASQCLGPSVIRDGIVGTEGIKPYNILILFFSLAYMAITLDVTGILQSAAYWVSNKGGDNGWRLYLYFYIMLTLLSVLLGNDPVILSGTAFLVYYTRVVQELKPMPWPWLIAEFAAANTASMVLFVGNPTNVVICEGFGVNNAAFTAYTILPFLACNVACFVALALQFRSQKHIPRKITPTQLDVRSVLLDPVSAWVGSILLGTCLVVIIVVSFFKVDVWKISLPFAVAKFIWDLAWDHYRFVKGKPMLGHVQTNPDEKSSPSDSISDEPMTMVDPSQPVTIPDRSQTMTLTNPSRTNTLNTRRKRGTGETEETDETGGTNDSGDTEHSGRSKNPLINSDSPRMWTDTEKQYSRPQTPPPQSPPPQSLLPQTLPPPQPKSFFPQLKDHFPTFFTALPRLPFALVPFAFSQFILIEGLSHEGWIDVFATWLVRASHRQIYPVIWLIGVLGVILCNISGTNIGATILLTKVVRAADLPDHTLRAAAISLAVASNIGAVSFTFSASLAGLLWRTILEQKDMHIKQLQFAKYNLLPLAAMTGVGLAVVSAEMAVLYKGKIS